MAPVEKSTDKIIPNPSDALEFKPVKRARPRRTGLKFFMFFILLCGAAGLGWQFYGNHLMYRVGDQLPIIRAIEGPVKIRPRTPGGMAIPDRDKLVYGRMNGGVAEPRVERLLPLPEIPKKPQVSANQSDSSPRSETGPSIIQSLPKKSNSLPKKDLKESKVKSEMAAVNVTASKSNSEPVTVPKRNSKPVTAPKSNPLPLTTSEKASVSPQVSASDTPISGIAYQVQIAAVRSRERANSEWTRLKRKHGDLLADYSLNVVRVDLGPTKGIFYRLRAGPIAWEDVAKSLCENLIKRKVGCLIVRPGG